MLRVRLQNEFGDDIQFSDPPFEWSGWLSFRARGEAAGRLQRYLRQRTHDHPDRRHILIAHSHGGNVAIRVAQDPELRDSIAGIACLSTPFLHFGTSDVDPAAKRSAQTAVALIGGVALAAVVVLLSLWALATLGLLSLSVTAIIVVTTMIVSAFVSATFADWLIPITAATDSFESTAAPWSSLQGKLLIVRSPADEASGLLASSQLIRWLSVRLAKYTWVWLTASIVVAASVAWRSVPDGVTLPNTGLPAAWPLLLFLVISVLGVSICLLVLVAIASITSVFFGPDAIRSGFSVRVSAESTPPGTWTVHCVAWANNNVVRADRSASPRGGSTPPS